ncbi:MAG TPA: hypothetical protein VLF66_12710, partial [Thermoanaerobaculia bacterium]|nr:hypothetical protein [Thermoanaerobaculia bacterium]
GGRAVRVLPLYRIDQARGIVQTPPGQVPGGGMVQVAGLSPVEGQVRLAMQGLPGMAGTGGRSPSLSVDVTEKPLIQLVWIGLWVILLGGGLAVFQRLRQALQGAPQTVTQNPEP